MSDYKYLVHQFQSQESARLKNKIENNRLENELRGKGGIEYERAFHLKKMDQEKRRMEQELDSMRRHGRRKSSLRISQPDILMTSLNPPLTKPEVRDRERNYPAIIHSQRTNMNSYFDKALTSRPQAYKESEIKTTPAQKTAQDYQGQTVSPVVVNTEPVRTRIGPPEQQSVDLIPQTVREGDERHSPLSNPFIYPRRHMVQFVDERLLTHNKEKSSKFSAGSVVYYPPTNTADSDSPKWIRQYKPTNSNPAIGDLNVNTAKENVARRLTDTETSGSGRAAAGGHGESAKPQEDSSENVGSGQLDSSTEMAANSSTGSTGKPDEASTGKVRKNSKANDSTDLLKGSKFDPDKYNPDGSLRTKHQVPNFQEAYEQARNARYIRSKERSDLDRELEISEVFQKSDNSDKPIGST